MTEKEKKFDEVESMQSSEKVAFSKNKEEPGSSVNEDYCDDLRLIAPTADPLEPHVAHTGIPKPMFCAHLNS